MIKLAARKIFTSKYLSRDFSGSIVNFWLLKMIMCYNFVEINEMISHVKQSHVRGSTFSSDSLCDDEQFFLGVAWERSRPTYQVQQ